MKKKVSVIGLGESGLASALFLKKRSFDVFVSDAEDSEILQRRAEILRKEGIAFELGRHSLEKVSRSDWALISPGILPSSEIYQSLHQKGIPLFSEIELASRFSEGEVIAVTGTTGKTTVTTLIHRIFEAHGILSLSCGNIGNPWIGEVERITPQTQIVLEVSSFQLLHTYSLHPRIGILLNIGPNHLDWHPTMADYVAAKLRVFQNQTPADTALIRRKDQKEFFPDFRFKGKVIYCEEGEGKNSNENLLYHITRLKGLDPSKTRAVLESFEGLEHRLERVAVIDGVEFVNDSKCTTLEALQWGLERFADKRVILLAGGHAKAGDFRPVRSSLSRKAKQVVIFGEASELLWENWEGSAPLTRSDDLKGAFECALKLARPGDVILLSPACASFDQFANYRERGELFKKLVPTLSL